MCVFFWFPLEEVARTWEIKSWRWGKKKRSPLVVLLRMTYRSCSLPDPRAKLNMIAEDNSFSLLKMLTNVIKCIITRRQTKLVQVFCYPVEFCLGIRQGSVRHNRATSKHSLSSSKIWFLTYGSMQCPTSSGFACQQVSNSNYHKTTFTQTLPVALNS